MESTRKGVRNEAGESLRYSQPSWWKVGVTYYLLTTGVSVIYIIVFKLMNLGKMLDSLWAAANGVGSWQIQHLPLILLNVASIILFWCLFVGLQGYCLGIYRSAEVGFWILFSGIWRIGPIFILHILTGFFCALWAAIPIVFGLFIQVVLFLIAGPDVLHSVVSPILVVIALLCVTVYIYKMLQYKMAPYVILDDPYETARGAIRKSKAMMRGQCGSLLLLQLSFLGHWLLLALITIVGAILAGSLYLSILTSNSIAEIQTAFVRMIGAVVQSTTTGENLLQVFTLMRAPMLGVWAWCMGEIELSGVLQAIACILVPVLLTLPLRLRMIIHYTCAEAGLYDGSLKQASPNRGAGASQFQFITTGK